MPLLKSDAVALGAAEVQALRERLTTPFTHEVVERDERRFIFVRAPAAEPDPVQDVDAALEALPAYLLANLNDLILLGDRNDLHVPGHILRPIIQQIAHLDTMLATHVRNRLDVHYGVELYRVTSDANGLQRLLVRIPRERCADLSEADLVALASILGPWIDDGRLAPVRCCHLVAESDALRLSAPDVLEDLRERWKPIRQVREMEATRAAAALQSQIIAPITFVEAPAPSPPRRVEDVSPVFEIEQELVATDPGAIDDGTQDLSRRLQAVGYTIEPAPAIAGAPFVFEARRNLAFPKSVGVVVRPNLDRAEADRLLALARESGVDLIYAVSSMTTQGALKRLAASKVKVIKPGTPADVPA